MRTATGPVRAAAAGRRHRVRPAGRWHRLRVANPPHRLRAGDDAGITLAEIMISMTIMAIFMTMFSTGVIQVFRATNRTEATATAQAQLNIAFMRLDKEVRYASEVSAPGTVAGNHYVEYLTTHTAQFCTRLVLQVATGTLWRVQWNVASSVDPAGPASAPPPGTPKRPLVTGVTVPATPAPASSSAPATPTTPVTSGPFTHRPANTTFNFQRLQLRLASTAGKGVTASRTETDVTFTAMNTSLATAKPTTCTHGRTIG